MSMMNVIPTVVLVVVSILVSPGAAVGDEPPRSGTPAHRFMEPGLSYLSIEVPDQISEHEWERYANTLQLSDAQRHLFKRLYDDYRRVDWTYRVKAIKPLVERSAALAADSDPLSQAEAMVELMSDRHSKMPPIQSFETRLFDDLAPVLTDEQLVLLERVKHQRRRERSVGHTKFPGSMVDLTVFLERLSYQGIDTRPKDPNTFNAILNDYESQITPLFERRSETVIRNRSKANLMFSKAMYVLDTASDSNDPAVKARSEEFLEERREIRKEHVRFAQRIHDMNRRFLDLFAYELPAEAAQALIDQFRLKVYPVVYPNPYDLSALLDKTQQLASLSAEQRDDVQAVVLLHQNRHAQLNQEMVGIYLAWKEETSINHGYELDDYYEYSGKIQELDTQRRIHAEMILTLLRDLLTPEQLAEIEEVLNAWNEHLAEILASRDKQAQRYYLDWPNPYQ